MKLSLVAASPETKVEGEDCPCLPECPARRDTDSTLNAALCPALCDLNISNKTQVIDKT